MKLKAGLRTYVISLEFLGGSSQDDKGAELGDKKVELTWPPRDTEGVIEKREGFAQFFSGPSQPMMP